MSNTPKWLSDPRDGKHDQLVALKVEYMDVKKEIGNDGLTPTSLTEYEKKIKIIESQGEALLRQCRDECYSVIIPDIQKIVDSAKELADSIKEKKQDQHYICNTDATTI